MALQDLASALAIASTSPSPVVPPSPRPGQHVDGEHLAPSRIPASMHARIPRDANRISLCLRFFGCSMCIGGTMNRCAAAGQTYTWLGELPAALVAFIAKHSDTVALEGDEALLVR